MLPDIPPQILSAFADAPLALLVVWMIHQLRRELAAKPPEPAPPPAPDALAEFKLEVARTYVPLSLIRDLDSRLSLQLLRIEEKLDEVSRAAAAAEAVSGQGVGGRRIGFATRGAEEAGHG